MAIFVTVERMKRMITVESPSSHEDASGLADGYLGVSGPQFVETQFVSPLLKFCSIINPFRISSPAAHT